MILAKSDLYVRGKKLAKAIKPCPQARDFSIGHPHCSYGLAKARAARNPYFFLCDDSEEIWLLSNCPVQDHAFLIDELMFRLSTTEQTRNPMALV